MFHSKAGATLAAAVALMTGACSDSEPAAPTTPDVTNPQYLYSNGPSTPNVLRIFGENIQFAVFDDQTGLIAWAGLPTDPTQAVDCGGNQTAEPIPLQLAGLNQALNVLAVAREINIHVYDNATLEDTCFEQPIASGTGHMVYTDNDIADAGPGAEAFGLTLVGIVTTAGGETLRLQGETHFLVSPDGGFRLVTSHLSLTPVGGQ